MAGTGWEIRERSDGTLMLLRHDRETGKEVVELLDPSATLDDLQAHVLQHGDVGDWCMGPGEYEGLMLVGEEFTPGDPAGGENGDPE